MESGLLHLEVSDQFIGAFHRKTIVDGRSDALVTENRVVDFNALFTHGSPQGSGGSTTELSVTEKCRGRSGDGISLAEFIGSRNRNDSSTGSEHGETRTRASRSERDETDEGDHIAHMNKQAANIDGTNGQPEVDYFRPSRFRRRLSAF
jgi:hypothetical protein